jgi:hypothetical protein
LGFGAHDSNLLRYVGNDSMNAVDITGMAASGFPFPIDIGPPVFPFSTRTVTPVLLTPPTLPLAVPVWSPAFMAEVNKLLMQTPSGQKAINWLKLNQATFTMRLVPEIYYYKLFTQNGVIMRDVIDRAYGLTVDKTIYISLSQSAIDAAAAIVHEVAHAAGGSEFEARLADIRFYMEQSIRSRFPLMYKPYLDGGVVTADPTMPYYYRVNEGELIRLSLIGLNNGGPTPGTLSNIHVSQGNDGVVWTIPGPN